MQPISAQFVAQNKNSFFELALHQEIAYTTFFDKQTNKIGIKSFQEKQGVILEKKHNLGNYNIGSKVHEYGGGAIAFGPEVCFFVNQADQQIYSYNLKEPHNISQLTKVPDYCFADLFFCLKKQMLFAVCEQKKIASNSLIAYHLPSQKFQTLLSGRDCYSNFCVSKQGDKIAWLEWDFPDMPWDQCELWVAVWNDDFQITKKQKISFPQESIFQPSFSPQGQLFFVSDKENWWNIFLWDGEKRVPCLPLAAEFATPQWVFGLSSYGFLSSNQLACSYLQDGYWYFATWDCDSQKSITHQKFALIQNLKAENTKAVFLASQPQQNLSLYFYDNTKNTLQRVEKNNSLTISVPESIAFVNSSGVKIQAFFYEVANSKKLIIKPHGGPTGFSDAGLDWGVQYWTSRGFSYLDVNYRGSSGFGRDFRNCLYGHWGNYDVQDILEAIDWVLSHTKINFQSIILKGNSAGAFTVLCALSQKPQDFYGAICYYPVTDPTELLKKTHPFELGYLQKLLGAQHQKKEFWKLSRLQKPLLFLQGAADKVVPPEGVQKFAELLKTKNIPCDFHLFEKEGHGFHSPQNIQKALILEEKFCQAY